MTAIEHDIDRVSKVKAYKAQVINIISNEHLWLRGTGNKLREVVELLLIKTKINLTT